MGSAHLCHGAVHEIDLAPMLAAGGVFAPIRDDRAVFEAVSVIRIAHDLLARRCRSGPLRPSRRRDAGLGAGISTARDHARLSLNTNPSVPRIAGKTAPRPKCSSRIASRSLATDGFRTSRMEDAVAWANSPLCSRSNAQRTSGCGWKNRAGWIARRTLGP